MRNEIVLFEDRDIKLEVPITPELETVWLNRNQMAELFGRDIKTIGKHIGNAKREELEGQEVVAKFATTTKHGAIEGKTQADMQKLEKQYELDLEKEQEKFVMEKEKMEIEHRHQLELLQSEFENSLGASVTNTLISEAMKMPEVRQQLTQGIKNGNKRKKR